MGTSEILSGRGGRPVKRNPRQSLGASQHLWDSQKKIRNNGRILWEFRRDKVASKSNEEGCWGKKRIVQ